jgi:hypothetical protein
LAICYGETPAMNSRKIPFDDGRFAGLDFTLSGRHAAAAQRFDDAVPVAETAGRFPFLNTPAQSAMSLLCEILQEQGVHRALEANMQVRDVTLGERDDVHAREREAFEQAGRVFLVAAESIERLGENHIELMAERIAHQRLKSCAKQSGTRDRMIGILLSDRPAIAFGESAAHAQLVGDGCSRWLSDE